ncbi:diguanylate cyclase [Desulfogranum japonicum]|uniref:diguanylate cyclase n=1 Tax=Desulfogranum japonicum TaxID=231447 RepID=UPI00048B2FC2|nr:diguanylate cyclase [Desulfogranum japonicum]
MNQEQNPPTVLVVDDSATMRTIIRRELNAEGYETILFQDGLEAVSSLAWMESPPDLITLDIDMPRMDGFTCCELLRQQEAKGLFGKEASPVPVLFVSANDTMENRRRGFQLGSLEFISKPFKRGDIAKAVNRLLKPEKEYEGMGVLLVDDDPLVRQLVSNSLKCIGVTIFEACDGQEGYDLFLANYKHIDLVIFDICMPRMNGDEFLYLLRQLPQAENLQTLFFSGNANTDMILTMFRMGVRDYLVKPFIAEELLARVRNQLDLRNYINQLEKVNQNLYELAVRDSLTGLYNKRYFNENTQAMVARHTRNGQILSCLFFDIDFFKKVNDSCGHAFGDYVLKTIGELLLKNTRAGDLVARYGGEEFVIALPDTDLQSAHGKAEQLRKLVESTSFADREQTWKVTISIGVSCIPVNDGKGANVQLLLEQADQALYRAKEGGRNQVVSF